MPILLKVYTRQFEDLLAIFVPVDWAYGSDRSQWRTMGSPASAALVLSSSGRWENMAPTARGVMGDWLRWQIWDAQLAWVIVSINQYYIMADG
jgi:hypothetical protein